MENVLKFFTPFIFYKDVSLMPYNIMTYRKYKKYIFKHVFFTIVFVLGCPKSLNFLNIIFINIISVS